MGLKFQTFYFFSQIPKKNHATRMLIVEEKKGTLTSGPSLCPFLPRNLPASPATDQHLPDIALH